MASAISPTSVSVSTIQVNPKVSTDLQSNVPQVAQDLQKGVKAAQTDTVTISPQALKLADDKNATAKETAKKADEQRALKLAGDKVYDARATNHKSAEKAYSAMA